MSTLKRTFIIAGLLTTAIIIRPMLGKAGTPDVWQEMASLPAPTAAFQDSEFAGTQGLNMFFNNGYAYVFPGCDNTSSNWENDIYYAQIQPNGMIDSWSTQPVTPDFWRLYFQQMVVKAGDHVYLVTGADGAMDVMYAPISADGSIGSWSYTSYLDPSRQTHAIATNGDYIYSIAGNSGGIRDFVEYATINSDGSLSAWQYTKPTPVPMQSHAAAIYDDVLYAVEPGTGNTYYSKINPTDGSLSDWSATEQVPGEPTRYALVATNNRLFLIGGTGGPNTDVYTAYIKSDGSLCPWQETDPLPEGRYGLFAGADGRYIYIAGGLDKDTRNYTDTVYRAKTAQLQRPPACPNPSGK